MQTLLGLRFVPFPGPSSSGDQVFGERGRRDLPPPGPAARFSGRTAGAPSQADVDRPEPQEGLAKKPACNLVDNVPLGLLALVACHRRGMVCSRLILLLPLFCVRSWWCLEVK